MLGILVIPINAIQSSFILDLLEKFCLVSLNWIELIIFILRALAMIDIFLKVGSVLVIASPSDDCFYKVWIIFLNILKGVPIIPMEMKRHFEIDVGAKTDWIINIKVRFNRVRCNCGVMSLRQMDELQ